MALSVTLLPLLQAFVLESHKSRSVLQVSALFFLHSSIMPKRHADSDLSSPPRQSRDWKQVIISQSEYILSNGFVTSVSCESCALSGEDCTMDRTRHYLKCASCTRHRRMCRREFHTGNEWSLLKRAEEKVSSDMEKNENELDLLEPELSSLQDHLAQLHQQVLEKQQAFQVAMAHQRRLRQQEAFLKQKGFRMSEHDTELLRILDEKSSEQPDPPVEEVQQLAATSDNPSDFNQILEELSVVPPSFWESADLSVGGIPSPSGGIHPSAQ